MVCLFPSRGRSAKVRAVLRSLDDADLDTFFDPSVRHANLSVRMQSNSSFLAGPAPQLHAVCHGGNCSTTLPDTPEGGNFLLLPRVLLSRPPRGRVVSRELIARFDRFSAGDWQDLIRQSSG